MDCLVLQTLPMPPSANQRMVPVNGRLIKSADCRTYDKAIQIWMLRQKGKLVENRHKVKDWIDHGFCLKIYCEFYWPKEKLITKDGHPKRNDLDNRLKTLIDAVSDIIDLDDKFIIEIHARKVHWINNWEEVQVSISPTHWPETSE